VLCESKFYVIVRKGRLQGVIVRKGKLQGVWNGIVPFGAARCNGAVLNH